ncbi:MAG: phosphatase PAP2 family protein [Dokdonella sp.]|nr:MAG: phosphatase PAP2 family protein [Dokdonella sp.]
MGDSRPPAPACAGARPWRRAFAWLAFLGPFFFASYGFATWVSAQRADVGSLVFAWERYVPLLPWTIVPYWLIDLLYGVSLFLCVTRRQLDTHALRLLTTQVLAVTCFLLAPLRCTFERGEVSGAFGWLFDLLTSFDQPFNQAPSLHIALLVVLLEPYLRAAPRRWHGLVYVTALLIAASVMTTWQHHFFDLPTGAWLGCFVLWLLPSDARPLLGRLRLVPDRKRRCLAAAYGGAGLLLGGMALALGGAGLWLLWAAASLALLAVIYLAGDAEAFAKQPDGSLPCAVRCLLAPYLAAAWLNSRWWTRHLAAVNEVAAGVALGRLPSADQLPALGVRCVVDLCAELPFPASGLHYASIPVLDLIPPTPGQIERAVQAIDVARRQGPVLVCCALGLARSAVVLAAWLLHAGIAASPAAAIAQVRAARPAVVLGVREVVLLEQWLDGRSAA